jgi:hypothetical protein
MFTNPNARKTPQIRLSPQPRQSARCLGVSVVRDPEIATTKAAINNPKKLTPTIFSARTAHLFMRVLLVPPTDCHSGLQSVKQTNPDPPSPAGTRLSDNTVAGMRLKRSPEAAEIVHEIQSRLSDIPIVNTPAVRDICRGVSGQIKNQTQEVVMQVARLLLSEQSGLHRLIAYELVSRHKQTFERLCTESLLELGKGINSWSSVDC